MTRGVNCDLNIAFMTKAKTWGKQARRVFWDSNTFPKVWKSESQHSQIVFPLWELKSHGLSKF